MSKSEQNARISKFLDSKRAMMDLSMIIEPRAGRSRQDRMEVADTPFIALAIQR